jgi:hypothetical protein
VADAQLKEKANQRTFPRLCGLHATPLNVTLPADFI